MVAEKSSFGKPPCASERWFLLKKASCRVKAYWRQLRITCLATKLLGSQYRRSRDKIEIDITYDCNLKCLNCNRSVKQAPEKLHISLTTIQRFVADSIDAGKLWSRIRVLGGEPALHPQFKEIIDELLRYRDWNTECIIEVVSNGYGEYVQSQLSGLPSEVWIENSHKTGPVQPDFAPFNMAPVDDSRFSRSDYTNGCAIMHECGMGLTPLGYYPCAIAGGIDRIAGKYAGRSSLPGDHDDMRDLLTQFCSLCGRFKDGHYVPRNLRPRLCGQPVSPAWKKLYAEWHRKRKSSQGGCETGGKG